MVEGILSSRPQAVNETAVEVGGHATIRTMAVERAPEPSQFRVALFVGPQPVEGKPFTSSCVFNVKKRSWKGGIQVAVVNNGKAEFRKVKVRRDLGTRVEVDSGIKAGDQVILNPPVTLVDGGKIRAMPEAPRT